MLTLEKAIQLSGADLSLADEFLVRSPPGLPDLSLLSLSKRVTR